MNHRPLLALKNHKELERVMVCPEPALASNFRPNLTWWHAFSAFENDSVAVACKHKMADEWQVDLPPPH
jgi:hypothetical protein